MLRCPPLITAFWACLVYVVTILIERWSIISMACQQLCQLQVHREVFPFGPLAYAWYEPVGPSSLVGFGPVWLSYIHSIINQLDRVQKISFPPCIMFPSLYVHYQFRCGHVCVPEFLCDPMLYIRVYTNGYAYFKHEIIH